MLVVPWQQLSEQALEGLVEAFVLREGTDYGAREVPFVTKVAQVREQLARGEAVIVFDEATESCTLLPYAEVPPDVKRQWP